MIQSLKISIYGWLTVVFTFFVLAEMRLEYVKQILMLSCMTILPILISSYIIVRLLYIPLTRYHDASWTDKRTRNKAIYFGIFYTFLLVEVAILVLMFGLFMYQTITGAHIVSIEMLVVMLAVGPAVGSWAIVLLGLLQAKYLKQHFIAKRLS
jgi:hypothetical protein